MKSLADLLSYCAPTFKFSFLTYGGVECGVEGNRPSNHIIFLLHADDPPVEVSVVGGCLKDFVAAQIN